MQMTETQLEQIKNQLKRLVKVKGGFYAKKFKGIDIESIKTQADFEKLPFTWKGDLRDAYPLGLTAVPEDKIVRIHSSSGTTGTPVIIPYTQKDVDDWATMFARCRSEERRVGKECGRAVRARGLVVCVKQEA